jgi:hypothetical protein
MNAYKGEKLGMKLIERKESGNRADRIFGKLTLVMGASLVSLTGWAPGDEKPEGMHQKKPVTPTLMRVLISPDEYYNYEFTDEKNWRSCRLELRNSEFAFQGYVDRGSEVGKALAGLEKKGASTPCLVKVAYPRKARTKDQVEIVEVISAGWIYEESPKKK